MANLTDSQLADLVQAQYDYIPHIFDSIGIVSGVDYALKSYPDCTVISFEGSHDIPDWESNFRFNMIRVSGIGGVEEGFYQGLLAVYQSRGYNLPMDKPVYCIGHSRGAAHAHIFAAILIQAGYKPENVIRVVWGSPKPGDASLTASLARSPCRSYRNYHDALKQDFVCVVPEPLPDMPFEHPGPYILIDEAPPEPDPWLLLARHHFYLYQKGTQKCSINQPQT